MTHYQKMLTEIHDILMTQRLPYMDSIIIGDNASGKSEILYQLLCDSGQGKYYFVDAVNRYFDVAQIGGFIPDQIVYSSEINRFRLEPDKFNLDDSFYYKGTPRAIEDFYFAYEKQLRDMMGRFLETEFQIKQVVGGWEPYINGQKVKLSSGYQALLRMFLEVLYYASTVGQGMVVIDEIDEYLSVKNSSRVFNFLRKSFSQLHFLVTTHSADLIASAESANLIVLQDGTFEVLDADDFESVSQVYNIFQKFLSNDNISDKQMRDHQLRILLNNKIAGIWGVQEEENLQILEKQNLTKAQMVLVREIRGW